MARRIIRFVEGAPEGAPAHVTEPAHTEPDHDKPPALPVDTDPEKTKDNDVHAALASLTETVASLQGQVAELVAGNATPAQTDPKPTRKPWTHRKFGDRS
jgi:hypothetical protein